MKSYLPDLPEVKMAIFGDHTDKHSLISALFSPPSSLATILAKLPNDRSSTLCLTPRGKVGIALIQSSGVHQSNEPFNSNPPSSSVLPKP
jgi:hypothetical protein